MNVKRIIALLACLSVLTALTGCGTNTVSTGGSAAGPVGSADEDITIGIVQYAGHQALAQAREGFISALADHGYIEGENVTFDFENAMADAGTLSAICQRFAENDDDLILAIGTPAAQAAKSATSDIPIVGTAVTDYVETGLIKSNDAPGGNVTGTSDSNPINAQVALMLELCPDVKTVGILYTSGEENSALQASAVMELCEAQGVTVREGIVTNSNNIQQVTDALAAEVEAIYIPTDNIIASNMLIVEQVCREYGVPTFCGEANMVLKGGFAAYSIDYELLGYEAGKMAVQILEGAKPAKMPIVFADADTYTINSDQAENLQIEIPENYQDALVSPSGEDKIVPPEDADATPKVPD